MKNKKLKTFQTEVKPIVEEVKQDSDFEIIYETNKLFGDYLICKHCNERVERGIITVSNHLYSCAKRRGNIINKTT